MDTQVFNASGIKLQLFGLSYKALPSQILLTFQSSCLPYPQYTLPCSPTKWPVITNCSITHTGPLLEAHVPHCHPWRHHIKTQPSSPQLFPRCSLRCSSIALVSCSYHSWSFASSSHTQCNPETWWLSFSPFVWFQSQRSARPWQTVDSQHHCEGRSRLAWVQISTLPLDSYGAVGKFLLQQSASWQIGAMTPISPHSYETEWDLGKGPGTQWTI